MPPDQDITLEQLNADTGRNRRNQQAVAISQKYQTQLEEPENQIEFVGELPDCTGELWVFSARNDYETRQHGFDVHTWRQEDLLQGGVKWLGFAGRDVYILAQPSADAGERNRPAKK